MAKGNNNLRLQAGRLVSGSSPVGSIAEVRRNAGKGLGFVHFPTSRQQSANRKAGIPVRVGTHQPNHGFWGNG